MVSFLKKVSSDDPKLQLELRTTVLGPFFDQIASAFICVGPAEADRSLVPPRLLFS